jgi:hypothetical protein
MASKELDILDMDVVNFIFPNDWIWFLWALITDLHKDHLNFKRKL